jgi:deoxyribonuclease V
MTSSGTLACLDVAYSDDSAYAACVLFEEWRSEHPLRVVTRRVDGVAPYEPGAFYKRELPVLLEVLADAGERYATIVVDGYVWLDAYLRPGLGAHLHQALGQAIPVIGVAKTAFHDDAWSVRVLRGQSQRPLFVTAAGMDPAMAAANITAMHGDGRIPTVLRLADRHARDTAAAAASAPNLLGS